MSRRMTRLEWARWAWTQYRTVLHADRLTAAKAALRFFIT
jgi:hypothetical protein